MQGTSSNGLLGHPIGHPVVRSPPGVITLPMESGFEFVGSYPMCDSVKNVYFLSGI